MAMQVQSPAVVTKGWMSFTIAGGATLELGGAAATVPTAYLSKAAGNGGATQFLANGIPQRNNKTGFKHEPAFDGDVEMHAIKHAQIAIISAGGGATTARSAQDGSAPTTTLGRSRAIGEVIAISNSPTEIFNFKLTNSSGGNMVVEVEVFE